MGRRERRSIPWGWGGRSEPGGDSWEGRLKEVLGGVVNHASLRHVKWTQGKEGCVHKNEHPVPKALEFFWLSESILSCFSTPFLGYCHHQPSLQAWPVEVRLTHFRTEVFEGNLGGACFILKLYVLEQPLSRTPMCEIFGCQPCHC